MQSTTGTPGGTAAVVQVGEHLGTRYELVDPGSTTTMVRVYLEPDSPIRAIPGCMVAHSGNVEVKGKVKKTFKAVLGPDDATYQTMTAIEKTGWVLLAPRFYGEVRAVKLNGDDEVYIGDDAFLACTNGITITSTRQAMKKAIFSGHGLFVKKAKGTGVIFVGGVGSIMEWKLDDAQTLVVDNDHLVLWSKNIGYEVKKVSNTLFSTAASGEGMVAHFTGPGLVWCQARNSSEIAKWVYSTVRPPGG